MEVVRDNKGRFQTGGSRPHDWGKRRGVPNKITGELREVIRGALDAVGGQQYLAWVARTRPEVFCALLRAVIPVEVRGALLPAGGLLVISGVTSLPGEQLHTEVSGEVFELEPLHPESTDVASTP